ncbi:MAG: N-acetyltransferase [Chloroflexi bacterium]|nr:N-acetyltransferase [Chloroflexota bacterium]
MNRHIEAQRVGVRIRQAQESDARTIAEVHVRGWQWAYRGQLPDSYLDGLSANLEQRTQLWQRTLAHQPEQRVWVAEADRGIVGFAATFPSRDDDATPQIGEVGAIYLDTDWAGKGVGRVLFEQALDDLRLLGYDQATLWVLETNERARRFYEVAGFRPDGATKVVRCDDFELRELRYRLDLESLLPGSRIA